MGATTSAAPGPHHSHWCRYQLLRHPEPLEGRPVRPPRFTSMPTAPRPRQPTAPRPTRPRGAGLRVVGEGQPVRAAPRVTHAAAARRWCGTASPGAGDPPPTIGTRRAPRPSHRRRALRCPHPAPPSLRGMGVGGLGRVHPTLGAICRIRYACRCCPGCGAERLLVPPRLYPIHGTTSARIAYPTCCPQRAMRPVRSLHLTPHKP